MPDQNKALNPQGLTEIISTLVDELSNSNLLPPLSPEQKTDLVTSTVNGIKKTCGNEDLDNDSREALNIEVNMKDEKESGFSLMHAFKSVIIAECALNPEFNDKMNKELKNTFEEMQKNPELRATFQDNKLLDNPVIKLLFSQIPKDENGEKDDNKAREKFKEALKVQLTILLGNKLDAKEIDKLADKLMDKMSPKMKPGADMKEELDIAAKEKETVEYQMQLTMALAAVLGTNPFILGGSAPAPAAEIPASLGGMGIPNVNQGGGDAMNAAALGNTVEVGKADPNGLEAATMMNAVSAGSPIDTAVEIENAITNAQRLTLPSAPKNVH